MDSPKDRRLALGPAAVLNLSSAAELLPWRESEAIAWLRRRGLLRVEYELRRPAPEDRVLRCSLKTGRILGKRIAAACELAGVHRFPPGGFRRAVVQMLYQSSVSPDVAGRVMGHSMTVAMKHYRQIDDTETRLAVQRAELGRGLLDVREPELLQVAPVGVSAETLADLRGLVGRGLNQAQLEEILRAVQGAE